MAWVPIPAMLHKARNDKKWSLDTLAERSGVAAKTIWRLENLEVRTVRHDTLRAIAEALGCEMDTLAIWRGKAVLGRPPSLTGKRASTYQGPISPPGTVKPMLLPEAAEPRPRPLALTSEHLVEFDITFRAHQHKRFRVTGKVQSPVGLTDDEAIALGCTRGVGARFKVARGRGRGAEPVTVYTRTVEGTRALLEARGRAAVSIDTVLGVVETPFDHPTVSERDNLDHEGFRYRWTGFHQEGHEGTVPWVLVVE